MAWKKTRYNKILSTNVGYKIVKKLIIIIKIEKYNKIFLAIIWISNVLKNVINNTAGIKVIIVLI